VRLYKTGFYVLVGGMALVGVMSCSSPQRYDVPYFQEGKFRNQEGQSDKSFWAYLKMRLRTKQAKWPNEVKLKRSPVVPSPSEAELKITYINHSSFLIQIQGFNILTDPVFSERVSPVSWAGPRRAMAPGIPEKSLPKIDLILISHDHYDHLDLPFLKRISQRDRPKILVGLGAGRVFTEEESFQELAWEESFQVNELKLTFMPCQHFSGRTLFDRNTTLWGAWVIEANNLKIYFAGDTGYAGHFRKAKQKFGAFDVSLIPVGAYAPRSFMSFAHIDPAEAIQAHKDLESRFSLGMHWGTFQLTNEPRLEPKKKLEALASQQGIDTFWVPENTDCYQWSQQTLEPCRSRDEGER